MTKCATTIATAPVKASKKTDKGPSSKDLRAAFVVAYDSIESLGKVRSKANRAAKTYFDALAAGYDADATVVTDGHAAITESAEAAAAAIADLDAMSGVRYNAEDARMAGLASPPNGSRLASMLRESIGSKSAKTTAERLRG